MQLKGWLYCADTPNRKIAYFSLEFLSNMGSVPKEANKEAGKNANKALRFIFNVKGLTSFSQMRNMPVLNACEIFLFLLDALLQTSSHPLSMTLKGSVI